MVLCALHVQTEKASNIDVVQEVVVVVAGNFYNKYGNERDLFDVWPGLAWSGHLGLKSFDTMMILHFDRYICGLQYISSLERNEDN